MKMIEHNRFICHFYCHFPVFSPIFFQVRHDASEEVR